MACAIHSVSRSCESGILVLVHGSLILPHKSSCDLTPEDKYSPDYPCFPAIRSSCIPTSLLLSLFLTKHLREFYKMRSTILILLCLLSMSFGQNCGPQYGNQTCAPKICCMLKSSSLQCQDLPKLTDKCLCTGSGAGWVRSILMPFKLFTPTHSNA